MSAVVISSDMKYAKPSQQTKTSRQKATLIAACLSAGCSKHYKHSSLCRSKQDKQQEASIALALSALYGYWC